MRNIIVTGASRGLGLGIARQLARSGHQVIALARTQGSEIDAAMAQATAEGGAIRFKAFDLGDIDGIGAMVRGLREELGPIFGLVNNAAIGTDGLLATLHNSRIEQLIRVNTLSPIVLTKYVSRAMIAQGEGRIVNISSIVAFTGYSGLAAYAATKSAMLGFTRSLAREVGRLNVTVNAVAPGFMDTSMTEAMGDAQREQVARRSALKRLPEVDDVANAVDYLMSERAKNVTGTVMTIDAGATA